MIDVLCVFMCALEEGEWKEGRQRADEGLISHKSAVDQVKEERRSGGSKGLVPQQVKSIFLTSSSTTAPLSLDAEC